MNRGKIISSHLFFSYSQSKFESNLQINLCFFIFFSRKGKENRIELTFENQKKTDKEKMNLQIQPKIPFLK